MESSTDDAPVPPAVDVRRRMEDEYARCVDRGLPVTVLVLELADLDAITRAHALSSDAVMSALLELVRRTPHDRGLYAYGAGARIVAMLPGTALEEVDGPCRRMIADARKLAVAGAPAPLCAHLGIGLARSGGAGGKGERRHLFETLLLVAEESAAVATHRDGGCSVHSMLYDIMERRAQRLLAEEAGATIAAPAGTDDTPVPVLAIAPAASVVDPSPERASEEPGPVSPAVATDAAQAEIRAGLERVIERELEARPTTSEAERHLREMADELVARAMSRLRSPSEPLPLGPEARSEEIDRLERRIAKLTAALEETEARLARMGEERVGDPGLASSYRSVQGLRGTERDYERKMSLLRDILEANLDLQRKLATGGEPLAGPAPVPHEPVGREPA